MLVLGGARPEVAYFTLQILDKARKVKDICYLSMMTMECLHVTLPVSGG